MRHSENQANQVLTHWLSQFKPGQAFQQLAMLMPSAAVFVVDAEQRIVFWSQGAETLLGFKKQQLIGQHCLKANRCQACLSGCGLMDSGNVSNFAVSLYRTDGTQIQVRKHAQALYAEDGSFAGGIEVLIAEKPIKARSIAFPIPLDENKHSFHGILSRSPMMQQVFQVIRNTAETEATVLVRGESGSGKELVATALHELSHRAQEPFLAINCATLSANLLESELFGHVRGAFTGAIKDHTGLFQRAQGGTVFLDEIAELPLELQAKLLRVVQERNFIPVGGNEPVQIDVRIIAATHRSLREEVKAGRFREDLMYRLRVVPIFLPPLRERREDIHLLLWHFIKQHNDNGLRRIEQVSPDAMRTLLDYAWPGNIRELQNVVEYAFAVGRGEILGLTDLPPEFHEPTISEAPVKTLSPIKTQDEASLIRQALEASAGKIQPAADSLGMSRATFWRKRKQYGF